MYKSPSDASRQHTMLGAILHCLIAANTPVASPGSETSRGNEQKALPVVVVGK